MESGGGSCGTHPKRCIEVGMRWQLCLKVMRNAALEPHRSQKLIRVLTFKVIILLVWMISCDIGIYIFSQWHLENLGVLDATLRVYGMENINLCIPIFLSKIRNIPVRESVQLMAYTVWDADIIYYCVSVRNRSEYGAMVIPAELIVDV